MLVEDEGRKLQLLFSGEGLCSFSSFAGLGLFGFALRAIYLFSHHLGFQPVLNVVSIRTPFLLPNSVCKLPDLVVAVDLRILHNSVSFPLMNLKPFYTDFIYLCKEIFSGGKLPRLFLRASISSAFPDEHAVRYRNGVHETP
jgi:hypothetical protein